MHKTSQFKKKFLIRTLHQLLNFPIRNDPVPLPKMQKKKKSLNNNTSKLQLHFLNQCLQEKEWWLKCLKVLVRVAYIPSSPTVPGNWILFKSKNILKLSLNFFLCVYYRKRYLDTCCFYVVHS